LSELQDRLEHLINYSSQLIFVSGDSIAQQQRTLEDFLSVQKENTEISYFTSELTMESPDFRRIICRQLLGQKVGSFVRPLKELLKDLHQEPGPFLICIKQAQTLPNPFLQELWDWVTESKKLDTNHHVNVILFGETAWAEKAKKWLPKRNSSRPVLLSSQSVDSSKFDLNALETLMAEERPNFALGFFKRDEFAPPIVTQKWFIAAVMFLLFSVFVGLMSWQYPDHVKSLLQTGSLPPDSDLNADQLALLNEQLDREVVLGQTAQEEKAQETETQNDSGLIATWDEAKQTSNTKIETLKVDNEALALEPSLANPQAGDELKVSSAFEIVKNEELVDSRTAESGLIDESVDSNRLGEQSTFVEGSSSESSDLEGDFAVPDIISVEQLDARLGNELLPAQELSSTEAFSVEASSPTVIEDATPAEPETIADTTNYEFDETEILALSEPAVLLQISGIQNRSVLSEFIADNQLQNFVWVYQTTRYGGPWHVVLFNQAFDNLADAREAAALLPQSVQATSPFAKDLAQVKLEIRNR
jgi:DamX protein